MDYGYNPAQYLNDFSWLRDIGNSVSKFAYQVPELIDLNKQIKENNKAKDLIFSSVNRYIDKLDPKVVSNIVSSMNLTNGETYDDRKARELLKTKIPKFSEKTKNEDYTQQVVDYFTPIVKGAMSDAGGGKLEYADLMKGVDNESVTEGVNKTTFGKQQLEQQTYDKSREREQANYQTGFQRKYGEGGEVQTENSINNANALNMNKQTSQVNTEQGKVVANDAQKILSTYDKGDPESIFADEAFKDYSIESKNTAYKAAKETANNDLKVQLQDMRNKIQADINAKENLPKIYDQTQLENKLMDIRSKISDWSNKLKGFKKEQKGLPEYTSIEQNVQMAKVAERTYQGALKYLGSNPKATQEQVNTAMSTSRQNINPEDEQKFISDWKSNKYGNSPLNIFALGQEDDLQRFRKSYQQRFGSEPKIEKTKDAKGKTVYEIIPQQGNVKDVAATTNMSTSTNSNETSTLISALKAEIERRKQQGK